MLSKDKKTVIIYFNQEDLQKIDERAKKENRSRVNFIVNAVMEYLNKKGAD